jgi:hypothetical protein
MRKRVQLSRFLFCRDCGDAFRLSSDGKATHCCSLQIDKAAADAARKCREVGWEFDPQRGYS